jgi:hypothetical protein
LKRGFHIALIVFQAAWLNVVLPGHTRGIVTIPGYEPAAGEACHDRSACCPADERDGEKSRERRDRERHCAVCQFAAKLSTPPTIDYSLPPLALLELARIAEPELAFVPPPILAFDSRGPPMV